ncbi:hypothetical protein [Leptospira weilii]|uniref:hypothetical protein n=1 Tax=Leptospira weilii TaxID=28184 RepID=UPI000B074D1F|nr:hypothetical protein [Leptospira weilii]
MKYLLLYSSIFLVSCIADSERINCRENLDSINMDRDFVLTVLLSELTKENQSEDPSRTTRINYYFTSYYDLYQKSMERERKCDNNLILKIFSPESKDLK